MAKKIIFRHSSAAMNLQTAFYNKNRVKMMTHAANVMLMKLSDGNMNKKELKAEMDDDYTRVEINIALIILLLRGFITQRTTSIGGVIKDFLLTESGKIAAEALLALNNAAMVKAGVV